MLSISGELIMSRYIAESITTDAGRFILYAVDKGLRTQPKRPTSVVIDSATHLLMISSPNTLVNLVSYGGNIKLLSKPRHIYTL